MRYNADHKWSWSKFKHMLSYYALYFNIELCTAVSVTLVQTTVTMDHL